MKKYAYLVDLGLESQSPKSLAGCLGAVRPTAFNGDLAFSAGSRCGSSSIMSTFAISDVDRLVTISRVMLPDDANPGGNVHGGTILKMMEEAGWIAATKHCNVPTVTNGASTSSSLSGSLSARNPLAAALVRVEHMDFLQPMHVGEVAKVRYRHRN